MRAVLLTGVLCSSAIGRAQVKPYIIFDIDTSGSMGWDTCGNGGGFGGGWDDTTECPGVDQTCMGCNATGCDNGIADDSRLWKVKQGTSQVVNNFGEVTYALARFRATPQSNFVCDSGGWQGSCNGADILVPFYEGNQQDILEWMDFDDNYPGTCVPGTGGFPPTPSSGCPPASGCSLCADCGGGCDKELRPGSGTPVAASLASVEAYLAGVMASDPEAACRPYVAIALTDGEESCGGDPMFQASQICNNLGVPVYVIGFAEPSLQAGLDAIADAGCDTACDSRGCRDTAIMVDNEADLAIAFAEIIQGAVLFERCNGLDDNCNGLTDEDFPGLGDPCCNPCNGRVVCNADGDGTICNGFGPCNEVCNARDDDCDGLIDEGIVPACEYEVCNGIDDDGDGTTDELPLPGLGQECGTDTGECSLGVTCCDEGAFACCGADPPTAEICNCLDDNCNGLTDEAGSRRCYAGPPSECPDPQSGSCNGICQPGVQACVTTGCPGSAGYGPCVGDVGPRPEACNCLDDNCNGFVDDGATCPNGAACTDCGCPNICDPDSEFPCPLGYVCSGGCPGSPDPPVCLADPCLGRLCALGEQCDRCTGTCLDPCDDVVCGEGRACCAGVCCQTWEACQDLNGDLFPECEDVSCSNPAFPCGPGDVCKDHVCVGDPCAEMDCGEAQGCVDGACFPVCPRCRDDEHCVEGTCVLDPCAGASCVGANVICCAGDCINDPCAASIDCGFGETCDGCAGTCREDVCVRTHCPEGYDCVAGQCEPPSNRRNPATDLAASGAGGCACATARAASTHGTWILALAAAFLARRRPRRP
jgi:hypothetical protein